MSTSFIPFFYLKRICDTDYLLPYGQAVANHLPPIRLNDTGKRICELLSDGLTSEEVASRLAAEYGVDVSDTEAYAELINDVRSSSEYFERLRGCLNDYDMPNETHTSADAETSAGQVSSDAVSVEGQLATEAAHVESQSLPGSNSFAWEIAGLSFRMTSDFLPSEFLPFCTDSEPETPDQNITVTHFTNHPDISAQYTSSDNAQYRCLLSNPQMIIRESQMDYRISFPSYRYVNELVLSKDGSEVNIHISDTPREIVATTQEYETLTNGGLSYELFHALRVPFSYLALQSDLVLIHSASFLYKGAARLVSAPATTGKSTHVALWTKAGLAENLNGDLCLIGCTDKKPTAYGIPWCGTSHLSFCGSRPLGSIILLSRAETNYIEELSPAEQCLGASLRCISPTWNRELSEHVINLFEGITSQTNVFRLHATPDIGAMEICRARIDLPYA